jgi:hypothetical protein
MNPFKILILLITIGLLVPGCSSAPKNQEPQFRNTATGPDEDTKTEDDFNRGVASDPGSGSGVPVGDGEVSGIPHCDDPFRKQAEIITRTTRAMPDRGTCHAQLEQIARKNEGLSCVPGGGNSNTTQCTIAASGMQIIHYERGGALLMEIANRKQFPHISASAPAIWSQWAQRRSYAIGTFISDGCNMFASMLNELYGQEMDRVSGK